MVLIPLHREADRRAGTRTRQLCTAGGAAQLRLRLQEGRCLSQASFFLSHTKFAECTRRVYHLGYRTFLGGGAVRKLPVNKDCLDWIQNRNLEAIAEHGKIKWLLF